MTAFALALAASLAAQAAPPEDSSQDELRTFRSLTYVDVDTGAGYAANPTLSLDDDKGRAFARFGIRGVHERRTARTKSAVSVYLENTSYSGRYGSTRLAQFAARHELAANERVTVFGDVHAAVDKGGQLATRLLDSPVVVTEPALQLPSLPDAPLDYYSLTGRTYRFTSQLGSRIASSARDNFTFRIGYGKTDRRDDTFNSNQSDLFGAAAYDRQLTNRAAVGAILSARSTEYGDGDVRVLTPQITANLLLSKATRVSGAVGLSVAETNTDTRSDTSVGLAAQITVCHTGEYDLLCATVSRDQQSATALGPANAVAALVNYSLNIGERQTLAISASASRYSTDAPMARDFQAQETTSFAASAVYTRKIAQRLSGGANLSARKIAQLGPNPRADVSGSLFLRYRLGDLI